MEWTQFLIMLITMVGLFAWNRAEARSDARHMDAKLDANSQEMEAKMEANRRETFSILSAINEEIKDFHGRLCAIEERRKGDK